jgi:hypothetical protein
MPEGDLYGVVVWVQSEWRLTLYRRHAGRVAVVQGSQRYILRALAAVGLSPSVASFSEHWDRSGVTFFGE